MTDPPASRVDWFRLIVTLQQVCTLSESQLSARLGVHRTTINAWKRLGIEPAHNVGEKLIRLYCEQLSLRREDLPLKPAALVP